MSGSNEVKTGRRAVLTTATAPAPTSASSTAHTGKEGSKAGSTAGTATAPPPSKKSAADSTTAGEAKLKATSAAVSSETVEPTGTSVESKAAGGEADPTESPVPTGGDAASGAVDYTSKYGGRQVEKFINVPTTLVGLLLSKRPKAKSTTINQMQVMTHTIISKMLPTGLGAGSGQGVEGTYAPAEGPGSADAAAAETVVGTDGDAANDPVEVTDGVGTGEDQEVSSEEESESDEDSDGSDEEAEGDAEGAGETVEGQDGQERQEGATAATAPKSAAERAEDEVKRRAIAESERLGYVVFRVLGYHEENVDTVIGALQEIIGGERIGQVCEKLKVAAQKLQWPPNRLPPKWLRQKGEGGEVITKARKERPTKVRDPTARPKGSRLRRTDDQGEGTGVTSGDGAEDGGEGGAGVSSRYRGKNPRPPRGPPKEPREGGKERREAKEPRARPPKDSSGASAAAEA